jgi:hypothetical protein
MAYQYSYAYNGLHDRFFASILTGATTWEEPPRRREDSRYLEALVYRRDDDRLFRIRHAAAGSS